MRPIATSGRFALRRPRMINRVSVATTFAHPIVRLDYRVRMVFSPLGCSIIFSLLESAGRATPWMTGLLLLHAIAWPQIAYFRHLAPTRSEQSIAT